MKVPVPLSTAANAFAMQTMLRLKIMSNGPNRTIGDFDMKRVQRTIDAQLGQSSPVAERRSRRA